MPATRRRASVRSGISRYWAISCLESPLESRKRWTAAQVRPRWAAFMSEAVSRLLSPSALPTLDSLSLGTRGTNLATGSFLRTAMASWYAPGSSKLARIDSGKAERALCAEGPIPSRRWSQLCTESMNFCSVFGIAPWRLPGRRFGALLRPDCAIMFLR